MSVVLASLLTSHAAAESSHEVALARALFEEGVTLADKGDWSGAADRFERAYALKPTSGIAFNWASALSHVGKLTQAVELLEGVSRDPKAAPELKADSEQKLAEIAPRRPRLKLHVDASIANDSTVSVDDKPWPRAVWDVAVPVDPGSHMAIATRGEQELGRAEVELREGESRELALGAPIVASNQETRDEHAQSADRDTATNTKKPLYKSWILWASVGALVVAGTVVAVVATRGHGSESAAPVMGNAGAGVIRW